MTEHREMNSEKIIPYLILCVQVTLKLSSERKIFGRNLYFYTFEFAMDGVMQIPKIASRQLSYFPGGNFLVSL